MTGKQWSLVTLGLTLVLLTIVIALVVVIDPFEIYHPALFYQPDYASSTQSYSNAGIAKSYAYDGVIFGTSMVENCLPSDYEAALGGRFVKLPMNGGTARDHAKMLEIALRTHPLKNVVYGLDLFAFSLYSTNQKAQSPDYLYDDSLLNDVYYWFNSGVLFSHIPNALSRIGTPNFDTARDTMYFWDPPTLPGEEELKRRAQLERTLPSQQNSDRLLSFAQSNLEENLLPFIRENRDTVFHIFFPPYSMLYWTDIALGGELDARMAQKLELMLALLEEPNVRLYDFQTRRDWVENYNLYFDLMHYTSVINAAMAQAMAVGENLITAPEQAKAAVDRLREMALEPIR